MAYCRAERTHVYLPPSFPLALISAILNSSYRTIEETSDAGLIDKPTFAIADQNDVGRLSKEELAKYKNQDSHLH